jgi:thymidylate synthase
MFAQQTNMVPGKLIGSLGDTHIYDNHIDYVKKQLERDPTKYSVPNLVLNKADSLFDYKFDDFKIEGYESYPNWKNVPIAI